MIRKNRFSSLKFVPTCNLYKLRRGCFLVMVCNCHLNFYFQSVSTNAHVAFSMDQFTFTGRFQRYIIHKSKTEIVKCLRAYSIGLFSGTVSNV